MLFIGLASTIVVGPRGPSPEGLARRTAHGGLELTTQSLSSTTIDGHKAFQLTQVVDIPSLELLNFYQSTAVVLAGTNMYIIDELNGTNDPVSCSLVNRLISRVQALYKH